MKNIKRNLYFENKARISIDRLKERILKSNDIKPLYVNIKDKYDV